MRAPRSLSTSVALIAALALVLIAATTTMAGGRPLSAAMTGVEEVPIGDLDGTGSASFTLNQGQGTICFSWTAQDISLPVTASHIHVAPAGTAGPVVVPLTADDDDGVASGCVSGVSKDLVKAIRQNPSGYYVNVHNAEFPGGAVRGQLEK